jgi:hypothetical protein
MKSITSLKFLLLMSVLMLSTTTSLATGIEIRGAPQWVNDGTTCGMIQGHQWFQGVGSAPPVGDNALQVAMSKDRAERGLERLLSDYLDALSADYLGATKLAVDKSEVVRQFKGLVKKFLTEAKANARWQQSSTGILYSLIQLDMKTVNKVADSSQDVGSEIRDYIRKHGEKVFARCGQDF